MENARSPAARRTPSAVRVLVVEPDPQARRRLVAALDSEQEIEAWGLERDGVEALVDAAAAVGTSHAVVPLPTLRDLVRLVPPAPAELDACTPREREVMALVAEGATNPEVCAQLVITDATVRTHIRSLRRKLGARTRAELVSRAFALGHVSRAARERRQ